MSGARVMAIFQKDLRDAVRDSRLIVALAMPLLIGLLYSFMFQDETMPSVKLGVVSSVATTLPDTVRAATEQAVVLTVVSIPDEAGLTRQVKDEEVDIGVVVPASFDRDLAAGRSPTLTVILPAAPTYGGDYVAAILDRVTQAMAGQPPAATIERVTLPEQTGTAEAAFATLGARLIFVLIALILMLSMIAAYALPVTITEETEKRTLEALTLVASHGEVIAAKVLFGLTYCVISVPLMLAVTRSAPKDLPLFAAAFVVSSVTLVGFGLLLGGLIKTQSQLNTWSSLVILPLLAPAIIVGLPTPSVVNAIVYLIPTAQTMRLGVNAFAGKQLFAGQWLSFAILIGWAIIVYGLVWWRLSRQEST
jgi:ABC-2 type transport system permease protein